MSAFNEFYPESEIMRECPHGMWQAGMVVKIDGHLKKARAGAREAESKLINRIGQLRRCVEHFTVLQYMLQDSVKEAVEWLRSTGRRVDFSAEDPRYWITARDGKSPRW